MINEQVKNATDLNAVVVYIPQLVVVVCIRLDGKLIIVTNIY